MIKDLPQDYCPALGDWRIQDVQNGTFSNAVYTGTTWAELEPVPSGQPIGAVVEGLTLLGRRDRAFYYRAELEPGRSGQWPWTAPMNGSNSTWTAPQFTFGQLVWNRRNPKATPQMVTGISFVPAYDDHPVPMSEDEDLSSPQTWAYMLNYGEPGEVEEADLLARSELPRALADEQAEVARQVGSDNNLLLDSDEDAV